MPYGNYAATTESIYFLISVQFFLYNIAAKPNIKITRTEKMITKDKLSLVYF